MTLKKILILVIVLIAGADFFIWNLQGLETMTSSDVSLTEETPTTRSEKITIAEGDTYGVLMGRAQAPATTSAEIFNAAADTYDLSNIRAGRTLELIYDLASEALTQLIYQVSTEEELLITHRQTASTTAWVAERVAIPYEIRIKESGGTIETSMYASALTQGIDKRAIIDLAEVFQWSVDFALDVRQSDRYEFIYEERYRDGEYVMPGRILAGKYVNGETTYYAFYFEASEENKGYFDEEGNSVQKIFLKAPVAYRYISSGYTTGRRYIQAFNISTGHQAIDYAAAAGTPIRAVGDGTVVYSGRNGSYGNFVSVRHNQTYTTNYAHLSRLAVRNGQKVIQGQTIGYVGSTGLSTGPHLHYEMVKFGTKINPLLETFPPGEAIGEEHQARFIQEIGQYQQALKN